jgi:hypothetical protein
LFLANHNWLQVTLCRAKGGFKKSYFPSIARFVVLHHNDLPELDFSGGLLRPGEAGSLPCNDGDELAVIRHSAAR